MTPTIASRLNIAIKMRNGITFTVIERGLDVVTGEGSTLIHAHTSDERRGGSSRPQRRIHAREMFEMSKLASSAREPKAQSETHLGSSASHSGETAGDVSKRSRNLCTERA